MKMRIEPAPGRSVPDEKGDLLTGPRTVEVNSYWAILIVCGDVIEVKAAKKAAPKPAPKPEPAKEVTK